MWAGKTTHKSVWEGMQLACSTDHRGTGSPLMRATVLQRVASTSLGICGAWVAKPGEVILALQEQATVPQEAGMLQTQGKAVQWTWIE